jgi:hypothetical protein
MTSPETASSHDSFALRHLKVQLSVPMLMRFGPCRGSDKGFLSGQVVAITHAVEGGVLAFGCLEWATCSNGIERRALEEPTQSSPPRAHSSQTRA